jgi:hypothetical protein
VSKNPGLERLMITGFIASNKHSSMPFSSLLRLSAEDFEKDVDSKKETKY